MTAFFTEVLGLNLLMVGIMDQIPESLILVLLFEDS